MKHAAWTCLIFGICFASTALAQGLQRTEAAQGTPRTQVPQASRATLGEPVAQFKNLSGKVSVLRESGVVMAETGAPLFVADRLVSAPGASAGIVFRDGTLLTMGPASDVLVRDFVFEPRESRYAFSIYLAKGAAVYTSGKIGKLAPESVKVNSPTATVGVRGTSFIIQAE